MSTCSCVLSGPFMTCFSPLKTKYKKGKFASVSKHNNSKTYVTVDVNHKFLNSSFNAADTPAPGLDFARSQIYKSRGKWGHL